MDIKSYLENLGYVLVDHGSWWRTNAVYRGGDNPSALAIDKKTGKFIDFVDNKRGSLQDLIELTTKSEIVDFQEFLEELDINIGSDSITKPTQGQEKVWPLSTLDKLVPHYKFYEARGISKETLKFFQSGMFHSGSMNQRYVFPIFNKDGKIHGWSGRDMTEKRDAKWKHMGGKKNWVFPFYMQNKRGEYPTQESIKNNKTIILVESIGDLLALWERGYQNVLVTFGLKLSSKIISTILGCQPTQIIIALNNDEHNEMNRGKIAAINMFVHLSSVIDVNKIRIVLPIECNDFGEMHMDTGLFNKWVEATKSCNLKLLHGEIYKYIVSLKSDATSTQRDLVKLFKDMYTKL